MKTFFDTEWGKLREMTFKEKRQYIWEYYKAHMFLTAFFGSIIVSLIQVTFFNTAREDYLYIAWLANPVPVHYLQDLSDKLEVVVYDPETQMVSITSYAATQNPQQDMAIRVRFVGMLYSGAMDMILTTRVGVHEIAEQGFIRPVHGITQQLEHINPQLNEKLSQRLLTITYRPYEASPYITDDMAIPMAGSPLLSYFGIDSDDIYLTMVITSEKYYEVTKALEVFFE